MEDHYTGLKAIYFKRILKKIIKIGNLNNKIVLDFGCGPGKLKKMLPNVINYDIVSDLSEVDDWKKQKFDIVVSNQVFYSMSKKEIEDFLDELYQHSPSTTLVTGIGRKGLLNKLGAMIFQKDAHEKYITEPSGELEILKSRLKIIKKTSIFFLCDVYLMEFIK